MVLLPRPIGVNLRPALIAAALLLAGGCTTGDPGAQGSAEAASPSPTARIDRLAFGCGPSDGPFVGGTVQGPPDFVGVVEVVADDGPLGSGEVARDTPASTVLRFGVDVSVTPAERRLPEQAEVVLRARRGGAVLDARTLRLESPPDALPCG